MAFEDNYIENGRLFKLGESTARLYKPVGTVSGKKLCVLINNAVKKLNAGFRDAEARYSSGEKIPAGYEWLLDNRYLAVREAKIAASEFERARSLRVSGDGVIILRAAQTLVNSGMGKLDGERIKLFLEGFQSVSALPSEELYLFPAALRAALVIRLSDCRDAEGFEAVFSSLRCLASENIRRLLEQVDMTEKLLMSEPAGIYPQMSEETRAHYRKALAENAAKCGMTEQSYAARLLENAKKDARHVGFELFPEEAHSGAWYIAVNILATLFLTVLCGFLSRSVLAAALLLLPISELTKSLIDNVVLMLLTPRFTPRMEYPEGIPENGKTVCVISALLNDKKSGERLSERLEHFYLSNRRCGDNLLFGILADLPECEAAVSAEDAALISSAARAIKRLNEKYGEHFYLFTRARTEDEARRIFCGKERKRGAILALARLISGEKSELRVTVGDAERLFGARFILSLDADTTLLPDTAEELIGAMLHPLNEAVIDEDKLRVVRGHGIIFPRICTEIKSVCATDFSRLFAGAGGCEPYSSLCAELYNDLFCSGGFPGKGIIDARALIACSEHIPEGLVLSHDALEGAYLRGGYMSDAEFSDSFPAKALSYYRRSHRWIRGDWQNAPWIFSKRAFLPDIERWKLFDSLRRSLVPPTTFAAIFLGLIFPDEGLILAGTAALLALGTRLLFALTEFVSASKADLELKFHSRLLGGISLALGQTLFRLWLLPFDAWISISAILTSLWRMCISGRDLLEWETSAQSERKKQTLFSHYRNMWLAPVSGIALLLVSYGALSKLVGLLWLVAPMTALSLSLPLEGERKTDSDTRRYLMKCAEDIWSYFEKFCSAEDNYLPPDNLQEQPPVGIAHRTSPTNIGLALCSSLCAIELGIDRSGAALNIIESAVSTLERLPKYKGHFLNWYDTRTLKALSPKYVSTVDSGNIYASLLALKNGLCKLNHHALAARVDALLAPMSFAPLFDAEKRLFYIGFDLEKNSPSPGHYDLMASEARLTSYIAVAKGDVPKKHWRQLSRAMLRKGPYQGMASWTGTMFEYLMPELFLPLSRDSLLYESSKYCLYVQKSRRAASGIWGISESAFYSLDSSLSYRYKANGCAHLALKRGQDNELVISPYSSFLALGLDEKGAVKNLRRLEGIGAKGQYGFYEAVDFSPARCRNESGEIVRSYMAHHLGMSMVSIANCLSPGFMQRLFMLTPEMKAYESLLHERLPQSMAVLELRENSDAQKLGKASQWLLRGEDLSFENPSCTILSNGVYSVMLTETLNTLSLRGDMLIYKPSYRAYENEGGIRLMLNAGDEHYSLLPEVNNSYVNSMYELGEASCTSLIETDLLRAECCAAVSGADMGEMRYVSVRAAQDIENAVICLEFEPVLADYNDYVNHPAFWRLGMEAYIDSDCLMIKRLRRGAAPEAWMCLACDRAAEFSADRYGSLGHLAYPFVTVSVPVSLKAGESFSLRFAVCTGDTADEAYCGAQHMLAIGAGEYGSLVSAAASLLGLSSDEVGRAMRALSPCLFPRKREHAFAAKQELWQYGISGDMPIITADTESIESSLKRFCLLRSCGFSADLVCFSDEDGEYTRPVYSEILDILSTYGLEALIGVHGGVHILPSSAQDIILRTASYSDGKAPERLTDAIYRLPYSAPRMAGAVPEYAWDKDGDFVFYVNQSLPARAWCNILTNGRFGYLAADCGSGNMWLRNAREMRINHWENDPCAVTGPERLEYVSDDGNYSLFAANDGIHCRVSYGFGFAKWEKDFGSFGIKTTAFVPLCADARVFIIEFTGDCSGSIAWSTELQMSSSRDDEVSVSCNYVNSVFSARGTRAYLRDTVFSATASAESLAWTCDLYSFLLGDYDGKTEDNIPVFAAEYPTGGTLILACGTCDGEMLTKLCKPEAAVLALDEVRAYWRERISVAFYGVRQIGHILPWCVYQTLACRIMGRCSLYQSGGAIGFRDQLQDAVNMLLLSPDYAKEQIILSCGHQYTGGDVMHWWHEHPNGDKGVRTRCSDDLLWLPWALCEYVEKTGDAELCSRSVHYVNSSELSPAERDRYEVPDRAELSESVYEHAERAIRRCFERGTGEHGLLFFGSSDWNDGMDEVNGESVWLSWFFAHTARRFADLTVLLCKPNAEDFRAMAAAVGAAADDAFEADRYLRGYWADGEPIGSAKGADCRIDSISQSWAAMCPDASNSKADLAIDTALRELFDREEKIVKLFDPPFDGSGRDPGYIKSYGPGFRENGGQYTHAAIWLAMACIRRGREKDGYDILLSILPEEHEARRYMAEPFVIPADLSSCPEHMGEAGWTWYTGSSGWYFRVFCEELLGLRLRNGMLYIRPALPEAMPDVTLTLKGHKICFSGGNIFLNGEIYDGKGIPYLD